MTSPEVERIDPGTPAPMPEEVLHRVDAHGPGFVEGVRMALRRVAKLGGDHRLAETGILRGRSLDPFHEGRAWWFSGGESGEAGDRSVLLGVAPGLVYSALDRKLGGSGDAAVPDRTPSPLERELGEELLGVMFEEISRGMSRPPLSLELEADRAVREPLRTFLPQLDAPYICLTLACNVAGQQHDLLFCLRRDVVEKSVLRQQPPTRDPRLRAALPESVRSAQVRLEAVLGSCRLRVQDVRALQVDDIVLFDEPAGAEVTLLVEGREKFRGQLGNHDDLYAVGVTELLEGRSSSHPPAADEEYGAAPTNGEPTSSEDATEAGAQGKGTQHGGR